MKAWFIEYDENGKKTKGFQVESYGYSEKGIQAISVKVPTNLNKTKSRFREIYVYRKYIENEFAKLDKSVENEETPECYICFEKSHWKCVDGKHRCQVHFDAYWYGKNGGIWNAIKRACGYKLQK